MRYLILLSLLAFIGCTRSIADTDTSEKELKNLETSINNNKIIDIDNLIKKSARTRLMADSLSRSSDRAINKKVDEQVRVVTVLKYKVVELKQTNEVLKVKIDSLDNIGKPYNLLPISYVEDHR
jgi:hypothetical protein